MSILRYFQRQPALPTPQQTGIGERATTEANAAIEKELSADAAGNSRKRKKYTEFSDEDRAVIGKHAAENGTLSAQKKFKSKFPDLGKSTVRLFKNKISSCCEAKSSTRRQLTRL